MWYQNILADPLLQVLVFILAIAVGLVLLRWIFKVAGRIIAVGCAAFFIIGAVLFILNFFVR